MIINVMKIMIIKRVQYSTW